MKKSIFLNLCFALVSLPMTSVAIAAPVGLYKVVDAYCTNPKYVFTPDEKAFIDNLKGIGCGTGRIQDMPCFQDYYEFGPQAGSGKMINVMTERPGIACSVTTPMTFKEKKPGFIEGILGTAVSAPVSDDPNVDISCGNKTEEDENGQQKPAQDNSFVLVYRMDGKNMLFIQSEDAECGEYIFKMVPVTKIK